MPEPRKRPTVKDVAAEAGVAVMTVSYTFNRPARVAEATRERVLAAADRLGYRRPDATARALRSGRTGQLGVVVGEHLSYVFADPQAAQFLAGVADVCVSEGLGMVLIPTHGRPAPGDGHPARATTSRRASTPAPLSDVDRVLSAAVDGYVLWTTTSDDPVPAAIAAGGRPAAIQGGPTVPGIVRIGPDDRAAAAAVATAGLARMRTIASRVVPVVLSFPLDQDRRSGLFRARELPDDIAFPVTASRLDGYRDALLAHGFDWDETIVAVAGRNDRDEAGTVAAALTETDDETALLVLAMSDELALGSLDILTASGRTVRATGWDDSAAGRAAGIISVTNPLRQQGRRCARAVLDPSIGAGAELPWEITDPLDPARRGHRTEASR